MSSEVVRLSLPPGPAPTRDAWYAVWKICWVRLYNQVYPTNLAREFLEDLLPDQEDRVMGLEPDALVFYFPDFGGAFSHIIRPIAQWFTLALATEYKAIQAALTRPDRPVRLRDLPHIQDVCDLSTWPTILKTRDRLFSVHRIHDQLYVEALDGREAITLSDEERARATTLLDTKTTEDPVYPRVRLYDLTMRRLEDESRELRADREALDAELRALPEGARFGAALAHPDQEVADAWINKEGAHLATPDLLQPHLDAHALRLLPRVERGYLKARSAERGRWLTLIHQLVAHHDARVARVALATRVAPPDLDATLRAVPIERARDDEGFAQGLLPWLATYLKRKPAKNTTPFDATPLLDAMRAHSALRAQLDMLQSGARAT